MSVKSKLARFTAIFLALVIVFVPLTSASATDELSGGVKKFTANLKYYASSGSISQKPSAQRVALGEYLNTQLKNFNTQISVLSYNIPATDAGMEYLNQILSNDLPESFHIGTTFYCFSNDAGTKLSYIQPQYNYTRAEYNTMYAKCQNQVNEILADIKDNDLLSDTGKALLIHDRLAVLCEYDEENYESGTVPRISHTMYGVLVNNVAVCQGYALAYNYLLKQVGIYSYYCSSDLLNHAWNIVYIEDEPFHVDITWDDRVWDITGRVNHDNFLRSTQGIASTGHVSKDGYIDYDTTPNNTTLDDAFWQKSEAEFVLVNDELYYIDNEEDHIMRYNNDGDDVSIYDIKTYWWADETHIWADQARLSTDGKDLLFSLADGIYKYEIATGKVTAVYKPELNKFWNVFGFTLKNGNIICDIYFTPNFTSETKKNYEIIIPYNSSQPTYTPGNINDDGEVNLSDVVVLAQKMAGWDVSCNQNALDVNGDSATNLQDVVYLAQYVAGWDVQLY